MEKRWLSISEKAVEQGVSIPTLRRWDKQGILVCEKRTFGNHRRYEPENSSNHKDTRKVIGYGRVSTHGQKEDLERQKDVLLQAGIDKVLTDIGSGINFKRPYFNQLLKMILHGEVKEVVLTRKDRWLRFGFPLMEQLCKFYGVNIRILYEEDEASFETTLVADIVTIMQVFCSKLYGMRSHKNKKTNKEKSSQVQVKADFKIKSDFS